MVSEAIKNNLSKEIISKLVDKNGSVHVNFFGLIADIELAIMEVALEYFKGHKTHTAAGLCMNRTTFTEKLKKFRGE